MKRSFLLPAALLFGGAAITPAMAQQAAAPAQTPAPATTTSPSATPAPGASTSTATPSTPGAAATAAPAIFTDAELVGFANAAIEADKIQKDAAIAPAEKQTKMLAAVQAQGLEPTRYNEIAQATRTDPSLVSKIQELAAASAAAKAPATATP